MKQTGSILSKPLCIGHRGAKGHLPENTLPSFELAISQQADWVELDIYLHEGELIVIHDNEVDRTTNGSGRLSDYSLAQLRELDAGNGQSVPTLPEVIDLIDRRCGLNVELKGANTAEPVCALLDVYLEKEWEIDQFSLSSFDHEELVKADPVYRRGALFGRLPDKLFERARALDAWSVNFSVRTVTEALVRQAHDLGFVVLVYTVNEPTEISRILKMGVDGIFSDFPDRLRDTIDSL